MVVTAVQVRLLRSEAKWARGSEFRDHLSPVQVGRKELCVSRAHLAGYLVWGQEAFPEAGGQEK